MTDTLTHQETRARARDQAHTLFAQTMGYVAGTAALFALGAYLGRNMTGGLGIVCVHRRLRLPDRHAVRRAPLQGLATVGLLGGVRPADRAGRGAGRSPTTPQADPQALWQAAGRRRCSSPASAPRATPPAATSASIARICFWALLALIVFGIVLIFVQHPERAR